MGTLPEWIQAVAALGIAALTLMTLTVLKKYAVDTRRLADDSASQVERAQMPFLAVVRNNEHRDWVIVNQGFGPAIKVAYHGFTGDGKPDQSNPVQTLAPGEVASAPIHLMNVNNNFDIDYESLAGKKYRSIVTTGGDPRTEFRKL